MDAVPPSANGPGPSWQCWNCEMWNPAGRAACGTCGAPSRRGGQVQQVCRRDQVASGDLDEILLRGLQQIVAGIRRDVASLRDRLAGAPIRTRNAVNELLASLSQAHEQVDARVAAKGAERAAGEASAANSDHELIDRVVTRLRPLASWSDTAGRLLIPLAAVEGVLKDELAAVREEAEIPAH